jgi:upstream activation factor subunit UAF30
MGVRGNAEGERGGASEKGKRRVSPALSQPVTPDAELAAVVGADPLPRPQVVKRLWDYIKAEGLQDPHDKRMINADEKLRAVFDGKDQVNMFEMTKHVSKHLH